MSRVKQDEVIKVGLCQGRHPLPVDDYIFPEVVENPFDFKSHEETAMDWVDSHSDIYWEEGSPLSNKVVRVYVTGLTPVLTALINAFTRHFVKFELAHCNMSHLILYIRHIRAYHRTFPFALLIFLSFLIII